MKTEFKTIRKNLNFIIIFSLIILIIVGSFFLYSSYPYLNDEIHRKVSNGLTITINEINCEVKICYTSYDGFIAGNPISFSANVTFFSNISNIEKIALVFKGAEKYYNTDATLEDFRKNVIYFDLDPDIYKYQASKEIEYNMGGTFDIEVQWIEKSNENLQFNRTENIMGISPYSDLHTIRNNNIMIGLAWLAVGITLLIPALNGLIIWLNKKD